MRLQLKRMTGVLVLAAAAMLVAAMGTSAAGASEWKTSGGFPVAFLAEGLGNSTFLSESLNSVSCKNSHSKGEVRSATLVKVLITYLTGCELVAVTPLVFKEACPTITTKELDVVPLSKLNGGTKTGLLVLPAAGTELANFTCSGGNKIAIKFTGSVIAESTPVGMLVTQSKVIYKALATKHGAQEFTSGTNPQGTVVKAGLKAESTLGIFKLTESDSLESTRDVIYSQAVEQTA
jgi:hypothetical protein